MRIPEPIETHGQFWLPTQPDNRLSGILRISEQGEASLELFGAFDQVTNRTVEYQLPLLIQGVTAEKGPVTLVDCLATNLTENEIGSNELLSKSDWYIGWAFCGAHFENKEMYLSQIQFSVEGLDEWFVFHNRVFSHEGDVGQTRITYTPPKPILVQLQDEVTLQFGMRTAHSAGWFQESITTEMTITIRSEKARLFSEFLEILGKVRSFLCLAFDRTVSYKFISGYRPGPNAPDAYNNSIDMFRHLEPYDLQKQEFGPRQFLIQFEDIAEGMNYYLPRWLNNYEEFEPTFNLYFAVTANRHMHLEGRFLFLAQGIESLHRRSSSEKRFSSEELDRRVEAVLGNTPPEWRQWLRSRLEYGNELSLRARINKMIEPFEELFGTQSARKGLVDRIVNTRNFLTHYDPKSRNRAVTNPEDLLRLYERMEGLLQLHMLKLLGIDDERIKTIAMQSRPLKDKLTTEYKTN